MARNRVAAVLLPMFAAVVGLVALGITQSIDVLGGPVVVSDSVVAEARIAAGG
ncbi:MAG TPA: hypothetical protein VIJ07_18000 [Dermatophilaceae bacterium]